MKASICLLFVTAAACCSTATGLVAQEPAAADKQPVRGSLVEDRAARKLLEAGDARYDSDEYSKAVEVWQSVIERYPRGRVRFDAHMRLGNFLLDRERAYDRARAHFEAVSAEENKDETQRAQATLKMGVCFYEARNYGKCFKVMRDVIEKFPTSPEVNQAYYFIGLGHFQLGHYSRAISALEKVGTALVTDVGKLDKVEAGKRLFVKIEDADLAALATDQVVKVRCQTTQGDVEVVNCLPVGHNVRVVLGSILTTLGKPVPNNGVLEVRGDDKVQVTYVDQHTADRNFDRPLLKEIQVVGDALVDITDGAFSESLRGVVLGRPVNLQITDADLDTSDQADTLKAVVEVYREKTTEEIETEQAAIATKAEGAAAGTPLPNLDQVLEQAKIDPLKQIDRVEITLTEVKLARLAPQAEKDPAADSAAEPDEPKQPEQPAAGKKPAAKPASDTPPPSKQPQTKQPNSAQPNTTQPKGTSSKAPGQDGPAAAGSVPASTVAVAKSVKPDESDPDQGHDDKPAPAPAIVDDGSIHSGVFRTAVSLVKAEQVVAGNDVLEALPNDVIRVTYLDERNSGDGPRTLKSSARAVEGNLGGRARDAGPDLRPGAADSNATQDGQRADEHRQPVQGVRAEKERGGEVRPGAQGVRRDHRRRDEARRAAARRDLRPALADLLRNGPVGAGGRDVPAIAARISLQRIRRRRLAAIGGRGSQARRLGPRHRHLQPAGRHAHQPVARRGSIRHCRVLRRNGQEGHRRRIDPAVRSVVQEYKKVFDSFPESGRVGEAVSKMANYYYQQKDYSRAIDIFESVLNDHPDAKFLDVILFNYGRCLYRLERKADARRQFDQLIADFPESPLAADAKRISEALAKAAEK